MVDSADFACVGHTVCMPHCVCVFAGTAETYTHAFGTATRTHPSPARIFGLLCYRSVVWNIPNVAFHTCAALNSWAIVILFDACSYPHRWSEQMRQAARCHPSLPAVLLPSSTEPQHCFYKWVERQSNASKHGHREGRPTQQRGATHRITAHKPYALLLRKTNIKIRNLTIKLPSFW